MEHFIGRNALLWQKLAVTVESDTTVEELQHALKSGATFLHIRCGNYTPPECITILERCNEAIDAYTKLCYPWKMATGIMCELSGPQPREETPPPIEAADVILVNGKELARVQDFLRDVNRLQLERNQQPLRTISPDDSALPYCLDFSSKEANASAIILPATSPKLANEICSINPLCNVLVITNSDQELNTLLLRKYAVPILELAASTIPQQRLIRRAIAYGRRFGYLHAGNCIVSGAELESDTDVVGMEVRYVPQVPEALQSESTV
uniref:Uncharacterized protein n=1 Tax=Anopheles coluzzii TaxID=1518534 RepID=A0A8W7Q339_ANOCL